MKITHENVVAVAVSLTAVCLITVILMALTGTFDNRKVYRAETASQLRNLQRHCVNDLGGIPTVETHWRQNGTGRTPTGFTLTCDVSGKDNRHP